MGRGGRERAGGCVPVSALAFARLQLRCSLRGEGAAPACWRPPPPARPRAPPLGGHPMTSVWRGSCEPLSHGGGAHARIPAAVCTWTRTRLTYMLAPHVVPLPLCAVCVLPPASLISLSRMRRPSTSIERMRSSSPTACRASLTAATGVPGTASSGGTLGMVPLVSGHRTGWGVKKEGERWGRAGGRRKEGGGVCSGALVSELIPSTAETRVHCLTFPYRGDAPCFSLPVLVSLVALVTPRCSSCAPPVDSRPTGRPPQPLRDQGVSRAGRLPILLHQRRRGAALQGPAGYAAMRMSPRGGREATRGGGGRVAAGRQWGMNGGRRRGRRFPCACAKNGPVGGRGHGVFVPGWWAGGGVVVIGSEAVVMPAAAARRGALAAASEPARTCAARARRRRAVAPRARRARRHRARRGRGCAGGAPGAPIARRGRGVPPGSAQPPSPCSPPSAGLV